MGMRSVLKGSVSPWSLAHNIISYNQKKTTEILTKGKSYSFFNHERFKK